MPNEGRPIKHAGSAGGRPPHTSAPLPLGHAIVWTPRGAAGEGNKAAASFPEGTYPLFLEHDVIAGVNRHLDRAEREPRFGFLLGRLYHCHEHDVDFAVADTAVAAREVLAEQTSGAYLIRAWSEAQSVFSGHSGLLLGWYHSHYRLGLMPSEADLDTNARYFSAPWQLSIIVVPDRARPLGGVFRHEPAAGPRPGRARPATFYEILPAPHGGEIGRASSAVTWANYEARPPVVPVATPVSAPPPAEASHAAGPEVAAKARVETEAREDPIPATAEGRSQPPSERSTRSARPSEASPATGAQSSEPEARERGVAMPSSGPSPEEDRPYAAGARGPGPSGVALVMPGEKAETGLLPPRSRRVGWPVVAAGIVLLAAALFFLLPDSPPTRGTSRAETTTPRGAAATSPELQAFIGQVEALEVAGERYEERAADFDAGRIGCDLLTTGYVAADEAYVRVAASFRDLPSRANPRAAAAYERAGEEIAAVNSHFDDSGCPRP